MSDERFDQLTRLLGQSRSRRSVLKGFAAAMVASVGAARGALAFGGPRCKLTTQPCATGAECCSGYCDDELGTCCLPEGNVCREDAHCCGEMVCIDDDGDGRGVCGFMVDGVCTDGYVCGEGNSEDFLCGEGFCFCVEDIEGNVQCGGNECGAPCDTNDDCGPDGFCQSPNAGCCGQVCIAFCGQVEVVGAAGGLTNSGR
jgi:hypothetical protein